MSKQTKVEDAMLVTQKGTRVRASTVRRRAKEAAKYAREKARKVRPKVRRRRSTLTLKTGEQIRAEIAERKRLQAQRRADRKAGAQ